MSDVARNIDGSTIDIKGAKGFVLGGGTNRFLCNKSTPVGTFCEAVLVLCSYQESNKRDPYFGKGQHSVGCGNKRESTQAIRVSRGIDTPVKRYSSVVILNLGGPGTLYDSKQSTRPSDVKSTRSAKTLSHPAGNSSEQPRVRSLDYLLAAVRRGETIGSVVLKVKGTSDAVDLVHASAAHKAKYLENPLLIWGKVKDVTQTPYKGAQIHLVDAADKVTILLTEEDIRDLLPYVVSDPEELRHHIEALNDKSGALSDDLKALFKRFDDFYKGRHVIAAGNYYEQQNSQRVYVRLLEPVLNCFSHHS